jgi:hypothetical protein
MKQVEGLRTSVRSYVAGFEALRRCSLIEARSTAARPSDMNMNCIAVESIDLMGTKPRHSQTNGIREPFHKTR